MYPQILSWLREIGRLTVRYILVGFAFVPAGLLYAELSQLGRTSVFSMGLCLALGFVMASTVWKWSATKLASASMPVISQAFAAALAGPALQDWASATTIGETQERALLSASLAGSHAVDRQFIAVTVSSHEDDYQRSSQVSFAQGAGTAHAAFSGIPS
jgi:hypothetical protein